LGQRDKRRNGAGRAVEEPGWEDGAEIEGYEVPEGSQLQDQLVGWLWKTVMEREQAATDMRVRKSALTCV
jgi:hypothetical protein